MGASATALDNQTLNVSYATLQAVLKHVNSVTGETFNRTWQRSDPLNHPMVDLDRVRELLKAGMTLKKISCDLNVRETTLRSVLFKAKSIPEQPFKRDPSQA